MSDDSEATPHSGELIWPPATVESGQGSGERRQTAETGDGEYPSPPEAGHGGAAEAETSPPADSSGAAQPEAATQTPLVEPPSPGPETETAPPEHRHESQPDVAAEPAAEQPPDTGTEAGDWAPGEHDLIPLLPRGTPLFDGIPAEAIVLEALCPPIGNGAIIVRRPDAVGVVLVKDGTLFEKYAFQGSQRLLGDGALAEINSWQQAVVSAYKFDPLIVAVAPSLLRGDPLYEDLRLGWADWHGLLADLCTRDGSYVVELDTPLGRGVTCILDGRQVATYTEGHPEFGENTLLDPLAATSRGTIWVRREPSIADEAAAEMAAVTSINSEMGSMAGYPGSDSGPWPAGGTSPGSPKPWEADYVHPSEPWPPPAPGGYGSHPMPPQPLPAHEAYPGPFPPPAAANPNDRYGYRDAGALQGASQLAGLSLELKQIARNRLQRSASRVERMIDEAVAQKRSLDELLIEIRGLVIRGVMQSTLDEVVDDMAARAGRPLR